MAVVEKNTMEIDEDSIVELIDEEGNTVVFEYVMTVEYGGKQYVLMSPQDNGEEAVFFNIKDDNADGMMLEVVTDEELLEKLYDIYLAENEDEMEQ